MQLGRFLLVAVGSCLLMFGSVCEAEPQDSLVDVYRGPQQQWPAATIDDGVDFKPLAPLENKPPFPESNPYSKEKWELGKQLFFERRLSKSEQIACASCHDPDLGWADGRRKAIGHNRIQHDLNSPSIVNSAWIEEVFWDGRAGSLEEQVLGSWQNPIEMAANLSDAVARIRSIEGYSPLFEQAFGSTDVSADRISQAIATFMRKITLTNTRFDKFMRGERDVLTESEIKGLHLFRTKARCANCHNGALLSDGEYHHLGSSFHNVGEFQGRYRVTGKAEDVGAFRTPGLRGIGETAPYQHNGFAKNLDILLNLYNMGWWQNAELAEKGNDIPTAQLSSHIQELKLNKEELSQLKAFLGTLDGDMPWYEMPEELE